MRFQPEGLEQLSPGQGRSPPPWVEDATTMQPERLRHEAATMPQSLARNALHLVFSTKHREPMIDRGIEPKLHAYLAGAMKELKCPALKIGGVADHVHILFLLARTVSLSDAVEEVKKSSSKWMKLQGVSNFYWQGGYGAFSVSASNETMVEAYIVNQPKHHRKMTFQDEFRTLFKKHGVEWDERYVWD
jgi:REP element-mobilizing transposase RayT